MSRAPPAVEAAARLTGNAARYLGFADGALAPFFKAMPTLFLQEHGRAGAGYQSLLYGVTHPITARHLDAIDDAYASRHPTWSAENRQEAIALLDGLRYPDARALRNVRGVPGLDLEHVSRYLHFLHHVYPIYDAASCAGLERLGFAMPFVKVRDPDVYGRYVQAIEALKERAPFWAFPESNVSLQRIVQAALHRWGAADRP